MPAPTPHKFKFIGCEIIYREACYLAATGRNRVDVQFLRKGLHDLESADMTSQVQQAIDAVETDAGYEAILLGYARCNDGLAGTHARNLPLVIPRAHDCITLFFGSRDAYQQYFSDHAGTYYMTTGWSERNETADDSLTRPAFGPQTVMGKLGMADSYEQLAAKYGADNAKYIAETIGDWTQHYTDLLYIEMDTCDESEYVAQARQIAEQRKWNFQCRKGDWSLLDKLFAGEWDDDFLIVQPGQKIVARNDEQIIAAE